VLAPQIFTRARDWPRFASAHYKLGRVSIKNLA